MKSPYSKSDSEILRKRFPQPSPRKKFRRRDCARSSVVAGFPQTWCTYGGLTGTINVSNGAPTGNCSTARECSTLRRSSQMGS